MMPLVQREFFAILRTRRALVMLLALTCVFSLLVVLRWPTDARVDLSGSRARQVFAVFGYGLFTGVLLLVPAFPAASIVREKRQGTLALLLNSPLRAYEIYGGKLVGVLLFTMLLLVTSLPAAAACYAMGGVAISDVLALYLVLILAAIQYATLALFISTRAGSVDGAVRIAYAAVFGIGLAVLGPDYLFHSVPGLGLLTSWLRAASPLPVIMSLMGHGGVGSHGLLSSSSGLVGFSLVSAGCSVLFAYLTLQRLNYRIFDQARDQGVITDDRELRHRVWRRLWFLVDPQRRAAGIPLLVNPVMVKEFRTRRFGRFHWMLRIISTCAVTSLILAVIGAIGAANWDVETVSGLMVLFQIGLLVLITPSLAATMISAERESGGWDLLRATPLSVFAIMRGKLYSVIFTLLLIIVATLPGYLVVLRISRDLWLQVWQVVACLGLATLYTLTISAAVGSLFRRTAMATTLTYVVLIALFALPLLVWLAEGQPFGHATVEQVLAANTTGAALSALEMPGFATYELIPVAWWVSGMTSVLAFSCFCFQVWRVSRPT